ncbi:MAG: hypothetical protein ACOYJ2_03470 [Rickettsiales bacterium]
MPERNQSNNQTKDRSIIQVIGDYFANGFMPGVVARATYNAVRPAGAPEAQPEIRTPKECEPAIGIGGMLGVVGCTLAYNQRGEGAPHTPAQPLAPAERAPK